MIDRHTVLLPILLLLILAPPAMARSNLFTPWNDGTDAQEPDMQVQTLDDDTYVLRQSFHTSAQAPFLYLLFGTDRALLLDTGDGGLAIRPAVDEVIGTWLESHDRRSIPLVVAHLHSHSDHHQGDAEFAGRPGTTVVGLAPEDVAAFFHIADWPHDIVEYDLGNRPLSIIPAPGHEAAHIVIYDPTTQILLSGDALLAGHILIPLDTFATFRESITRISDFLRDKPVRAILGTHVEMTRDPGKDYGFDATSHPDEHVLELPATALGALKTSLGAMAGTPVHEAHDDFIIEPVPHEIMEPYEYHG